MYDVTPCVRDDLRTSTCSSATINDAAGAGDWQFNCWSAPAVAPRLSQWNKHTRTSESQINTVDCKCWQRISLAARAEWNSVPERRAVDAHNISASRSRRRVAVIRNASVSDILQFNFNYCTHISPSLSRPSLSSPSMSGPPLSSPAMSSPSISGPAISAFQNIHHAVRRCRFTRFNACPRPPRTGFVLSVLTALTRPRLSSHIFWLSVCHWVRVLFILCWTNPS